jgi:hypothetical protein
MIQVVTFVEEKAICEKAIGEIAIGPAIQASPVGPIRNPPDLQKIAGACTIGTT